MKAEKEQDKPLKPVEIKRKTSRLSKYETDRALSACAAGQGLFDRQYFSSVQGLEGSHHGMDEYVELTYLCFGDIASR